MKLTSSGRSVKGRRREAAIEAVRGKKCDGIIGIVEEAKTAIDEIEEGAVLDAALIAGGDRLDPIAPHRMHLVVAAIVLDVNDTGDIERE